MGESKRRKLTDPNYGKTRASILDKYPEELPQVSTSQLLGLPATQKDIMMFASFKAVQIAAQKLHEHDPSKGAEEWEKWLTDEAIKVVEKGMRMAS